MPADIKMSQKVWRHILDHLNIPENYVGQIKIDMYVMDVPTVEVTILAPQSIADIDWQAILNASNVVVRVEPSDIRAGDMAHFFDALEDSVKQQRARWEAEQHDG